MLAQFLALCAATTLGVSAQTLTTLYSFTSGGNGEEPSSTLIQGRGGNLYGTTAYGGLHNFNGTVFKITPAGTLTTLYAFCHQTKCDDGYYPYAGLLQASNGNLYGTTEAGGSAGGGTVFQLTPGGVLTTLYDFCSSSNAVCPNGSNPYAGLARATDGNFYGTTAFGGANGNYGTVFRMTPAGALITLYSFCAVIGCTDGRIPSGPLLQGADGDLYGTTSYGGRYDGVNCSGQCGGTVFRITTGGALTTLYSFCSVTRCGDGEDPQGGLIQASDGNFYGTTSTGGPAFGTVFKITASGTLTTLHGFCEKAGCPDGESPEAGLVQGTDGNFYGTTIGGGAHGDFGTVFKITPGGSLTTLFSFNDPQSGSTDGQSPGAGLVQAANGDFYGTTEFGGVNGGGTVFRLSVLPQ